MAPRRPHSRPPRASSRRLGWASHITRTPGRSGTLEIKWLTGVCSERAGFSRCVLPRILRTSSECRRFRFLRRAWRCPSRSSTRSRDTLCRVLGSRSRFRIQLKTSSRRRARRQDATAASSLCERTRRRGESPTRSPHPDQCGQRSTATGLRAMSQASMSWPRPRRSPGMRQRGRRDYASSWANPIVRGSAGRVRSARSPSSPKEWRDSRRRDHKSDRHRHARFPRKPGRPGSVVGCSLAGESRCLSAVACGGRASHKRVVNRLAAG